MQVYAKVGVTFQIIDAREDGACPQGYILMKKPRPSDEWVAHASGDWVKPATRNEQELPEAASS